MSITIESLSAKKFTLAKEVNTRIPFIDTLVIRNNHRLEYVDVYRKEISTCLFIMSDSSHSFQHNMLAFNFLINCLVISPFNKHRLKIGLKRIIDIAK